MKRIILVISILVLTALAANEIVYGVVLGGQKMDKELLNSVSSKLIRFHVIANSDSAEDQSLKLKVRDEVLKLIAPELNECTSIEQARQVLKKNDAKIKDTAERIIKENGYKYEVNTALSKENFPVKSYGIVTLPQGNYEAYRILIGEAGGQNWWCVMFPPLCFIDITKGEVAEEKTAEEMKKVLSDEEFDFINNKSNNIELKFKLVEIFKSIKSYILSE
ncbi:stage II sporulation protein R [Clostridium thermarum]|uniref:stage II sporulation protein R n=1 Tax=Clostridium thermarum TaxID=1716543 RepID=UPI0013D17A55|nr:stage II sporulation protein R [Clostridium thermarum]